MRRFWAQCLPAPADSHWINQSAGLMLESAPLWSSATCDYPEHPFSGECSHWFTAAVFPSLAPPDTATLSRHRPRPRTPGTGAQWSWRWRCEGGPWCPERCSRKTEILQTSPGKPRLCVWRVGVSRTWTSCYGGMVCSFLLNTPDSRTAYCVPADSLPCLHFWRCCCRWRRCQRRLSTPPPSTPSPAAPLCKEPEGSAQTDPGGLRASGLTTCELPSCCTRSGGALSWQCWGLRSNNRQLGDKTRKISWYSN